MAKSQAQIVHAEPQKQFFISMITRDISLEACIMDLLDNSVDGATRARKSSAAKPYAGHTIDITFDADSFTIKDDCGGISIKDAVGYAFHFGKRTDAPDLKHGIGMYGIGMKRALFKIGTDIKVKSSTKSESFTVDIDVDAWEALREWEFKLVPGDAKPQAGTEIIVRSFNPGIGDEFSDAPFSTSLIRAISRVYARFIEDGLTIKVNRHQVKPFDFKLRDSKDFRPLHIQKNDQGVKVTILAGLAGLPPEDSSAEFKTPEAERYGWYVVCNGRVVIAGDKTRKTVWGDEGVPSWHSQYNGFLGIVEFDSDSPAKLPWTTTKADVDVTAPVYRKALVAMRKVTSQYCDYTTARKSHLEAAKKKERNAVETPIRDLPKRATMGVPKFVEKKAPEMVNIAFQKPLDIVEKAAKALGSPSMSYRTVGVKAFDYFVENEVGK